MLTADQRSALEARVRSGRGRADAARRARVILLLAEGCSYATIAANTVTLMNSKRKSIPRGVQY